jgi:hypothetical protein
MDEGERFRAKHLLCDVNVESLCGRTDEITAARPVAHNHTTAGPVPKVRLAAR